MATFKVFLTRRAVKDLSKIPSKLQDKARDIFLTVLAEEPFVGEKLVGDLKGNYSYELSYKDRIVYSVDKKEKIVYVKRVKGHYED